MSVTAQEKAVLGGLQQHSVGDEYPLAIVAYDHKDHGVVFTVENLQTGKVLMVPDSTTTPRQWIIAQHAVDYVSALLGGKEAHPPYALKACWVVGRPRFDEGGILTLQKEVVKSDVYNERKQQEQRKLRRPLTPREEYELAIAIENGD